MKSVFPTNKIKSKLLMKPLFVQLEINTSIFVKDPQKTELGKKIIGQSVVLIDEIGLEKFTFKKLAQKLNSAETSIYRYFENKHNLFVYLLNWYWEWTMVRINLNLLNVDDPVKKLKVAIGIIVDTANRNTAIDFIDEDLLHKIVVREGTKAYHHRFVDEDNEDGFFLAYKSLCNRIAEIITEIQPDFPYPRALSSTLIETANNNLYFARHLPRLTDLTESGSEESLNFRVKEMLDFFIFNLVHQNKSSSKTADQ
jgi:AcrR family transcriptional regulator